VKERSEQEEQGGSFFETATATEDTRRSKEGEVGIFL
jgi:hypothetical protein